MQAAGRRMRDYTLQDLRCTRCKLVRAGHFAIQCKCGGDLKNDKNPAEARRFLSLFHNLAGLHGFKVLQEYTARQLGTFKPEFE